MMSELEKELKKNFKKDVKTIKQSSFKLQNNSDEYYAYKSKVNDAAYALNVRAVEISEILKDLVGNPVADVLFGRPFSQASAISILRDVEFAAFLISANLLNRTLKLTYESKGEIIIRLYTAILNFDDYQKQKWCE